MKPTNRIKGNPLRMSVIFSQWLNGYSYIADNDLVDYAKAYKKVCFWK